LICTEGKTEALYFQNYRSTTGPLVIPLDKSDHKVSLVKRTIEEKQLQIDRGEFDDLIDEAWVILDRDADPRNSYPDVFRECFIRWTQELTQKFAVGEVTSLQQMVFECM
jgi:hypothetical protein